MAEIQIQGKTVLQLPKKQAIDGTEAVLLQDTEGSKHAMTTAFKEFMKQETGYLTGTGVTSIQTVTALPEKPLESVLYIVIAAEESV